MKYLALLLLLPLTASAATVIEYDDGTSYTLSPRERIYISTQPLYSTFVGKQVRENFKRDYVEIETDEDTGLPYCDELGRIGFGTSCVIRQTPEDECQQERITFGGGGC